MMIFYDDPPCECGSKCAVPPVEPSYVFTESQAVHDHLQALSQDTINPISFFRLPIEVRNKIYFLASRPDCQFSFGKHAGCEKPHVHQSTSGRKEMWKWTVLCQQTWKESIQYIPLIRQDNYFRVDDGNCPRCWSARSRSVREGCLHASIQNGSSFSCPLREIQAVRIRALTVRLVGTRYNNESEGHGIERFVHNLESFTSFVAKMTNLRRITVIPSIQLPHAISRNSRVAKAVQQFFSVLTYRKGYSSLEVIIEVCEKAGTENYFSKQWTLANSFLQRAASVDGVARTDFNYLYGLNLKPPTSSPFHGTDKQSERFTDSRVLYKTCLFDDDFEPGTDYDDKLIRSHDKNETVFRKFSDGYGPVYTVGSGCVYRSRHKYRFRDKALPLYQEEDFFQGSDMDAEYASIPECHDCKVVFTDLSQWVAHVEMCEAKPWVDKIPRTRFCQWSRHGPSFLPG